MDEMALDENRERGHAAAHIDHCRAELPLILSQYREAAGKRREQRADDVEMATFNRELEIVERRRLHRHRMHRDTDALAIHAGGIAHPARLVDDIGRWRALDDLVTLKLATRTPVGKKRAQMRVRHQRAI